MILSALAFIVLGCGTRKAEQFQALPFPDVQLPGMLVDTQDRAEYMAEHWWDRFTDTENIYPSDSMLVNGVSKDDVEQNFANWTPVWQGCRCRAPGYNVQCIRDIYRTYGEVSV